MNQNSIDNALNNIKDVREVLHSCVTRIAQNPDDMFHLLNYGLSKSSINKDLLKRIGAGMSIFDLNAMNENLKAVQLTDLEVEICKYRRKIIGKIDIKQRQQQKKKGKKKKKKKKIT